MKNTSTGMRALGSMCEGMNPHQHLLVLLPIVFVYFILACFGITRHSLWADEVYSIRDAASMAVSWSKGQGPLYYALLHVWMQVGTSELVLRAMSVLIGGVSVCLFYATSLYLNNRRVTVLGTLLFATSPFLIWYSQEVRYIILMIATTLLTMYALHRLVARGHLGKWVVYGITVILALFSFVTNIFLPVAQGLYLLWSPARRPLLKKWLVCQMLVAVLFLVWGGEKIIKRVKIRSPVNSQQTSLLQFNKVSRKTSREFTLAMLPYTFFTFSVGLSQGPSVRELQVSQSLETLLPYMPTLVSLGVLFGGLFTTGLVTVWRIPDTGKWLTLWVGIPLIGVLIMSVATGISYNVRYVAMVFPAFLLILTVGITRFHRPVIQAGLMAAVLCSNGLSLANYYVNPHYAREDARGAIAYLESEVTSEDIVVVLGTSMDVSSATLKYYATPTTLKVVYLSKVQAADPPLSERLRNMAQGFERLWLVESRPWMSDPQGKVKMALNDMYDFIQHKSFSGVDVYTYQLSP